MVKSALACVAAATVFTAVTAPEAKPDEGVGLSLLADAAHTGVIGVHVRSAPSTQVTLGEIVAGRRHPLKTVTSPAEYWDVAQLTRWRCDRQVRRFYATTELTTGEVASATSAVRTPSCRKRLVLHLPEQARPGRQARFVVRDRWRIGGVAGKVCLAGPREALRCHTFRIRKSRRSTALRVHLGWTGPWRVELRGPDQRRRLQIGAGRRASRQRPRPRLPSLFFTGDSMMANLDTIARDRLRGRARVSSTLRFATGLSKPGFDWIRAARRDARRRHPRAVVVFLGADEGFAMRDPRGNPVPCCGQEWVVEYARRVSAVVDGYATRVFWLTQPAPRAADRAEIYRAVNDGLALAAVGASDLELVDVADLLSPGFVFRTFMRLSGRRKRIRDRDGVHLTLAGALLADRLVMRALVEANIVRPPRR